MNERGPVWPWIVVAFGAFATAIVCAVILRPKAPPEVVDLEPKPIQEPETFEGTGLSYAVVSEGLIGYFDMQPQARHTENDINLMGLADNDQSFFSVNGPPDNLRGITLAVQFTSDLKTNVGIGAMMARLLTNSAPGWPGRNDWMIASLEAIRNDPSTKRRRSYAGNVYEIMHVKELAITFLTITPEASVEPMPPEIPPMHEVEPEGSPERTRT